MNAPMLVPPMRSIRTPAAWSSSITPICVKQRAPPPDSTSPTDAPREAPRDDRDVRRRRAPAAHAIGRPRRELVEQRAHPRRARRSEDARGRCSAGSSSPPLLGSGTVVDDQQHAVGLAQAALRPRRPVAPSRPPASTTCECSGSSRSSSSESACPGSAPSAIAAGVTCATLPSRPSAAASAMSMPAAAAPVVEGDDGDRRGRTRARPLRARPLASQSPSVRSSTRETAGEDSEERLEVLAPDPEQARVAPHAGRGRPRRVARSAPARRARSPPAARAAAWAPSPASRRRSPAARCAPGTGRPPRRPGGTATPRRAARPWSCAPRAASRASGARPANSGTSARNSAIVRGSAGAAACGRSDVTSRARRTAAGAGGAGSRTVSRVAPMSASTGATARTLPTATAPSATSAKQIVANSQARSNAASVSAGDGWPTSATRIATPSAAPIWRIELFSAVAPAKRPPGAFEHGDRADERERDADADRQHRRAGQVAGQVVGLGREALDQEQRAGGPDRPRPARSRGAGRDRRPACRRRRPRPPRGTARASRRGRPSAASSPRPRSGTGCSRARRAKNPALPMNVSTPLTANWRVREQLEVDDRRRLRPAAAREQAARRGGREQGAERLPREPAPALGLDDREASGADRERQAATRPPSRARRAGPPRGSRPARRLASRQTITPTGRLIRNTSRQLDSSTSRPPIDGPIPAASAPVARPHRDGLVAARLRVGLEDQAERGRDDDRRAGALQRARADQDADGRRGRAQEPTPTVKSATPAANIRRRPSRSAKRPARYEQRRDARCCRR